MANRACIAIDLKSFYASVECVERGLDPLTTNLVVADQSRTDKTICLAVSPSLKAYGLPGRCRLFEARAKLREVNAERSVRAPGGRLVGSSADANELADNPRLAADMVVAKPRMSHYLQQSAHIYEIYLRYAAAEDIHVYSVDEVFMDATRYLKARGMSPHELATAIVRDIYDRTGITATAGIGTNLYLCKVAMDIVAKHIPADRDGVRVAELDEASYRRLLWGHRPLTDFWRVGRGYANKLEAQGLMTMGDIARCSLGGPQEYYNEDLLYRMFGVNAELLIDHAWGWEPCTIADIKAYRPEGRSISSGQVLSGATPYATARLIVREMADALALELVGKGLVAGRVALHIGYDVSALESAGGVPASGSAGAAPASGPVDGTYASASPTTPTGTPPTAASSPTATASTVRRSSMTSQMASASPTAASTGQPPAASSPMAASTARLSAVASQMGTASKQTSTSSHSRVDSAVRRSSAAARGPSTSPGTTKQAMSTSYTGPVDTDRYGRRVPKPANGSMPLGMHTDSSATIRQAMMTLFDRLVDPNLPVRRITVVAGDVEDAGAANVDAGYEQPDLFTDLEEQDAARRKAAASQRREHEMQQTVLDIKRRFGNNAVVRGMNLEEGATGIARNAQIGGHAA